MYFTLLVRLIRVWLIWVVGLGFLVAYAIQMWFHTFVFFWKSEERIYNFFLFFYNTFDAVTHLLHTVSLKCGNSLSTQVKTNLMFAFTIQDFVEPIYFYVGTVFGLQAVCVTALFVCSWVMSGTWVAGMLAVSWYVINRWEHTTLLLNCVKTVVLNWQIKVCFENLILPFLF